jgi:parallel beta-helix repeat protein
MKKINLGVYFGIIIICICLLFETGYAATYYVKNSGDDNASGLDDQSAWRTINKVNSFVFSQGDAVLFKRGDTFADRGLRISNVENFTIADYGEGEKPLFDGNKILPIVIYDSKNVTVRNVDISGQEWLATKSTNLHLRNVEGLIIDGVYGNGHTYTGNSAGKSPILIESCSGVIEIKNCEIFNWGPYDLLDPENTTDFVGIVLHQIESGEYKIHNNKIHNISSDCILVYLTKAKGEIYNNILYNAGEDGIDVKGSENCEIFDNQFFRTADFLGEGGSGSGGLPTYIVVHDAYDRYSKNNTIRSNSFKNGDCAAIKLGKAEDTYIYENVFSEVNGALYIQNLVKNTLFHHNIIENPQSDCIYENNSHPGTQIYNNTIYNGKGNCKRLIHLEYTNGALIYNNIVYQNNSSEDTFGLYRTSNGTEPVIRDNYWYNPNKIDRTYYSNKIYTANMQEEWNEKHPGDKFDDPLMNDPEEGDYSLYDKDLKIGAVYSETEPEYISAELELQVLVAFINYPDADLEQLAELVFQKTGTRVSTEQIQMVFDEHGL